MVLYITVLVLCALVAIPLAGFVLAVPARRRAAGRSAPPGEAAASQTPSPGTAAIATGRLAPAVEVPTPGSLSEAPVVAPEDLRERLRVTQQALVGRLAGVLRGRRVDASLLEELEEVLFTADLGVATAQSLLETVRQEASGAKALRVREILRDAIFEKLRRVQSDRGPLATETSPHVILVLGVNGSGKTTTIGKLAARYQRAGKKVILGAGDTFRAAAVDQLEVWAGRVGCDIVKGRPGGDPASVAFDTMKAATARGVDVALIDTAGRLQTRRDLMDELEKIGRVIGGEIEGAPHESLLVLDANTGQNAISQARHFIEVTRVTGLVLAKLDGTAKGGVIVGLADEFGIPVQYVGVGEGVDDLRDFEARAFVDAIFEA